MKGENDRRSTWLYALAIALLAPALLINLGLMTFIDDEGIRSLVALEMKLSGNYITPTLHGVFYYNKPPLYNWLLLAFFELSGRIDEWTARLPTVICLLGYAATVFWFFRKHYDFRTAFLNAFTLITCGRILFWDSMLALIDISFSWVIFSMFMIVYHAFERQQWYRLFLGAYALTAVGFLLKGLPAIVFLGITLPVYFAWRGAFRRLFSWPHVAGGLLFLLITGAYYFVYSRYNSLDTVFGTLFTESSKRTVVRFGWWETLVHLFTFPFEMVYHFLPWSVMAVFLFRRDVAALIRKDRFITFNAIIFLANLLPYWTSPEVYPRYLLMMAPLVFSVFLHFFFIHEGERTRLYRGFIILFMIISGVLVFGAFSPLFLERTREVPYLWVKTLVPGAAMAVLVASFIWGRADRLLLLVLILLVFRIIFDLFVLPDRNANDYGNLCRISARDLGLRYAGRPLYMYGETGYQATTSFYLTNTRGRIVPRSTPNPDPGGFYIIDPRIYPDSFYQKVDELKVRHGTLKYYDIGRLQPSAEGKE